MKYIVPLLIVIMTFGCTSHQGSVEHAQIHIISRNEIHVYHCGSKVATTYENIGQVLTELSVPKNEPAAISVEANLAEVERNLIVDELANYGLLSGGILVVLDQPQP